MKNQIKLIAILLATVLMSACKKEVKQEAAELTVPEEQAGNYGASITDDKAVSIMEVSSLMGTSDSLELKLTGTIVKTCPKKGCWMTVDTGNGETMRVTFKDYGFFVPKTEMAGKTVVFQGKAFKTTTSVEELQHYADAGGASDEEIAKITEAKDEISFIADGVIIKV